VRNTVPITVVGNLTGDPELRFTPQGVAVARLTVAVNPRWFDKASNEWKDGDPSFYRVTAWRQLAEHAAESLTKGARVIVTGSIAQRAWEDDAGEKRSSWDVTADALGPDLAYATATVKRMQRAAGAREQTPPDDPWAAGTTEPPADDEPPF